MPAPLIGLTTRNLVAPTSGLPMVASPKSYTEMLMQSGAVPLLVPLNLRPDYLPELLSRLDGIIFTGGGDIDPRRFNGAPHEKVYDIDPQRDQTEIDLLHQACAAGLPFMGICRGAQLINVALGGDLYTHILDQLPGALEHSCFPANPPDYRAHPVEITPGSPLADFMGTTQAQVNSLHHQGIQHVAPQVTPLAWAPDGLVEAIQVPDNPFGIAVQWHPEWLPDDRPSQGLFAALTASAREYRSNHHSTGSAA